MLTLVDNYQEKTLCQSCLKLKFRDKRISHTRDNEEQCHIYSKICLECMKKKMEVAILSDDNAFECPLCYDIISHDNILTQILIS